MSPHLEITGLRHSFTGGQSAVDGIDLALESGEFLCLLGPSGCGKTTVLRAIGGSIEADEGTISIGGEDVTHLAPERRGVGMVFQSYALFPHLTARDNVAFGLAARGLSRPDRTRRANEWLERVRITSAEATRRPKELSGGQQQRVALARALAIEPRVLLLDEPLANLDRRLREDMRGEIRALQRRTGVTTVLVTHDQDEALSLSDRVGVLELGRLLQVGTPREVYERPSTVSVARFVGDANLWTVTAADGDVLHVSPGIVVRAARLAQPGSTLSIRPENVRIGAMARDIVNAWDARVASVTFFGADRVVELELDGSVRLRARVRRDHDVTLEVGSLVRAAVEPPDVWTVPESVAATRNLR